jgi:protein-tyrosine phosphatase
MKKLGVLFVCSGNICRSPLAEELLRRELDARGIGDQFFVDSAGTDPDHIGQQSDSRMRETARHRGVTVNHRARRLRREDLERFDLLIGMDDWHMRAIHGLERQTGTDAEIRKMLEFDPDYDGGQAPDVPDPWYGSMQGFERVYDMIEISCAGLANQLADRVSSSVADE